MAFCGNCGTKFEDGTSFCPGCGSPTGERMAQPRQQYGGQPRQQYGRGYSSPVVPGSRSREDNRDAEENKAMAILAYLGILVLIPLFAAKESPFARYHTNQGLVLAIVSIVFSIACSIIYAILMAISWRLVFIGTILLTLVGLAITVLAVIGIVNAAKGRRQPLPLIGGIRILK